MLKWICNYLIASASIAAFISCSGYKWGETEMPEALKKLNEE
ncbi:MAG: cyclic lactone autoinducer peptide [Lachnospiraceae bacterium]|nr:cyclic lactone autoinducer peptide [Lachnospiraceae bacterium]